MRLVKQYGLQRSGTNAIKALIEKNFEDSIVFSNYLGKKHESMTWETLVKKLSEQDPSNFGVPESLVPIISESITNNSIMFVFTIKEPVSWLDSYFRYRKKKMTNADPSRNFTFDTAFVDRALKQWMAVVPSWLAFHLENIDISVVVHHREVISGPERALRDFSQKSGWHFTSYQPVTHLEGYARRGNDFQHRDELINPRMRFDRSYHLEKKWIANMPAFAFEQAIHTFNTFKREFPEQAEVFRNEPWPIDVSEKLTNDDVS